MTSKGLGKMLEGELAISDCVHGRTIDNINCAQTGREDPIEASGNDPHKAKCPLSTIYTSPNVCVNIYFHIQHI